MQTFAAQLALQNSKPGHPSLSRRKIICEYLLHIAFVVCYTILKLNTLLKVVTKVTPWDGGIVAVNSFGVGGANGHCLMKSYTKMKTESITLEEQFPRLVIASARNESAIKYMINRVPTYSPQIYYRILLRF